MWLLQRKRRGLCRLAATCGLRFKGAPFRGVKQSWLGAGLSLLERSAGFWRAHRPCPCSLPTRVEGWGCWSQRICQ